MNRQKPIGWVYIDTRVCKGLTVQRLRSKFPRSNTIAQNQHYIQRLMDNPKTPVADKRLAYQFVTDNPDIFTALAEDTDSKEINLWAMKKNAGASFSWMKDFVCRYGWYKP
ncbi:MAG: hypothetical protein RBR71_11425 [Gudongella sp.]|nr:hypothetical protein [Gudongella sp.]